MDLSIIILNFKTKNLLRECLRTVEVAKPSLNFEVIVVDNASNDGTAEMLRAEFPSVRLIQSDRNRGYAGGNNLGIRAASGKYIMVMNPDILVWPQSIEKLVTFMDTHTDVGIAGPQLTNPDGTIQQSCYRYQTLLTPVYRRTILGKLPWAKRAVDLYLMKDFDHKTVRDVDWLLGGALIVRREAMEKVGLLDESFFLYFEDADWCRRFWEHGFRVTYVPDSSMVHFHQRASKGGVLTLVKNKVARVHVKSGITYFKKYRGKKNPRTGQSEHVS